MQSAITRTARAEGVTVTYTYIPGEHADGKVDKDKVVQLTALTLHLGTPERALQFRDMLTRALNTNDPDVSPDWALHILDHLTSTPSPMQRPVREMAGDFRSVGPDEVPYRPCPDDRVCEIAGNCVGKCSQREQAEGKVIVMPNGFRYRNGCLLPLEE